VPELPEAETIARTLAPHAEGRTVVRVDYLSDRVSPKPRAPLTGRSIRRVRRHGKQVMFELDHGLVLIKLGMTGALLVDQERGPYTRAILHLDRGRILFDDVRQFGSLRWMERLPETYGPDPLDITEAQFAALLEGRGAIIKRLLLDQHFLRGIGNIYADEMLFRAGIAPRAEAGRIGASRVARLYRAMREVLGEAIRAGGSSISDYVDARGDAGKFQVEHRVYGRQGEPCVRCGATIRRIVVAQRGTHYCPRCQR
jgi:formamidopyrimidine-DNA glycosylase